MIQFGNPVLATEIITHPEIRFLQSRAGVQSQVLIPFEFETRVGRTALSTQRG